MAQTIRGTILQTPSVGELQVLEDHVVTVDDHGRIDAVGPYGDGPVDITLPAESVLMPGLIDTHVHAPQWPQLGTGLDLPLERWLFEYTFPLESRFADLEFAVRVWDTMVPALLALGTTTAVYHGSTHEPATLALADACLRHGQRAFVGRVAMDHPDGTPDWYRDADADTSVEASRRSVDEIRALAGSDGLVQPIITPRFIPACTDRALEGLGELAASTGALVQTHCSESDWEHGHVLERCDRTDARALHDFGLVGEHTVLAHATHLTDADRGLLVDTGAGVSHCPLSNTYFANAVFAARRSLDAGVRVGLGTDVAGGSDPSLLAQCQHAVTSSRALEDGVDVGLATGRGVDGSRIDIATAFWMATGGGAELLGIPAGLLAPGRVFDAIEVSIGPASSVGGWPELDDWERIFEKVVRSADPRDIRTVWVDSRNIEPVREELGREGSVDLGEEGVDLG